MFFIKKTGVLQQNADICICFWRHSTAKQYFATQWWHLYMFLAAFYVGCTKYIKPRVYRVFLKILGSNVWHAASWAFWPGGQDILSLLTGQMCRLQKTVATQFIGPKVWGVQCSSEISSCWTSRRWCWNCWQHRSRATCMPVTPSTSHCSNHRTHCTFSWWRNTRRNTWDLRRFWPTICSSAD